MVKELAAATTVDEDSKNVASTSRAESILLCIKHSFPGLSQTTPDTGKIQFNNAIVLINNSIALRYLNLAWSHFYLNLA
jgi:hypothetical protein